jgi:hypothetical protein
MAKTFDNISEASATNYLFLFAQRTLALQNEPPTPPPLNVLGLPCHTMSLLWAKTAGAVKKEPTGEAEQVGLRRPREATEAAEAAPEAVPVVSEVSDVPEAPEVEAEVSVEAASAATAAEQAAAEAGQAAAEAETEVAEAAETEEVVETEGKDKGATFAEKIMPRAKKITEYILDHQDDAAQEDRWRTTMKRDMSKSFRKAETEMQAQREEKREEMQAQRKEKREEMQAQREEKREEMQAQREEKREEMQVLRGEMQAQREEMHAMQGRFDDVLSKLDRLVVPPMLEVECHKR